MMQNVGLVRDVRTMWALGVGTVKWKLGISEKRCRFYGLRNAMCVCSLLLLSWGLALVMLVVAGNWAILVVGVWVV